MTISQATASPARVELRHGVIARFTDVRAWTERLCRPLQTEDYVVQSMEDVSPTKWHLGHTSWFFETFLLAEFKQDYRLFNELYPYVFNSYYESVGQRVKRNKRGLLSRPTVSDVYRYRNHVDTRMLDLIESCDETVWNEIEPLITLGINHEQQHQELLITDIKHVLMNNPLRPVYKERTTNTDLKVAPERWLEFSQGVYDIGFSGSGFSFDNERPSHKVWLNDYRLLNRLVTNGEFMAFMEEGGYSNFSYWLSDGWYLVQAENWQAPLYWENVDGQWYQQTLSGFRPVDPAEPVCHVSYFEADAFARWAGKRLPSEAEWEVAATSLHASSPGNFLESENFHPVPYTGPDDSLGQLFGDVWEWTSSAYLPYPGFAPEPGAVGEYNGKFMSGQMILRGGSCATPANHIRATYRNFFQPDKRWQFTGIRLAAD